MISSASLFRPSAGVPHGERGNTLLSLLLGLLVGSLVLAAVASTFNFFASQRRQLVGGDGILQSAIGGLLDMQRNVKTAGGTMMAGQLLCSSINIYKNGVGTIADGTTTAPVLITAGSGATVSDQLTLNSSSSLFGTMPIRVISGMPNSSAVLKVNNTVGLANGDLFIVGQANSAMPCTLMQVTNLMTTGFGADIQHNPGSSGPYNPPNPNNVFTNAPSYPAGSFIMKAGAFNWITYRITGDNLELVDRMNATTTVVAENVVGMKVWYGTNSGVTKTVEQWVPATGGWAAPTATQIPAIRAVRIGLLVRNPEFVKPSSGNTCDASPNSVFTLWESGPTFDVSGTTDWACYRYRTVNLVVPLRSMIYGDQT